MSKRVVLQPAPYATVNPVIAVPEQESSDSDIDQNILHHRHKNAPPHRIEGKTLKSGELYFVKCMLHKRSCNATVCPFQMKACEREWKMRLSHTKQMFQRRIGSGSAKILSVTIILTKGNKSTKSCGVTLETLGEST